MEEAQVLSNGAVGLAYAGRIGIIDTVSQDRHAVYNRTETARKIQQQLHTKR